MSSIKTPTITGALDAYYEFRRKTGLEILNAQADAEFFDKARIEFQQLIDAGIIGAAPEMPTKFGTVMQIGGMIISRKGGTINNV